jgi:uncharacterized protein DUF6544
VTLIVVVAVVIAIGAVIISYAQTAAHDRFAERAARVRAAAGAYGAAPLTEDDLRALPEPMARHLRWAGAIGRPRISSVHVLHSGRFKFAASAPWLPIRGEYWITTRRPSFLWYGKVRLVPGVHLVAFDSYAEGRGRMLVKAMSTVSMVNDESTQVAQSAFGRCVAELTMAPTFFLDHNHVQCEQTGPDQVRCRVRDSGFSTDAEFFINRDGSLDRVVVIRPFTRSGGISTMERFTAKGSNPRAFAGRMLSSRLDGIWNLPEGDLHYVRFDVDRVEWE